MTEIATIDWFGRCGTSVFSENTAIFLYWSFWNFAHIFSMVLRCAWFGYNPWINFCHFFHFVNFVLFWLQILWKCVDSGYLVSATPYTISFLFSYNFAHLFPMVWRCACALDLILQLILFTFYFVNFVIFQFFAGATSTSPKFDLYYVYASFITIQWKCYIPLISEVVVNICSVIYFWRTVPIHLPFHTV